MKIEEEIWHIPYSDISNMIDFTMTYVEFLHDIKTMLEASDHAYDGWKLQECSEGVYLSKIIDRVIQLSPHEDDVDEDVHVKEMEISQMDFHVKSIKWEYNLVYNESYQVPMLCFNAWHRTGQVLTLQEIWNHLKCTTLNVDLYSMITQMDHSVHKRPTYALHPCKTHELLRNITGASKNHVVTWLSTIAPFIGLEFPDQIYYVCTVK